MLKVTYEQSFNKRAVQSDIFSGIKGKYKHIVGLAGPDINSYLQLVRKLGIKDASIYENNVLQLLTQINRFRPIMPTRVEYKDILHAPAGLKDTLYDLDFCCSVFTAEKHIKKFIHDDTITTVAIRPLTKEETINAYMYASFKTEKFNIDVSKETHSFTKYQLNFKNKNVGCYHYRDTSPMLVFTNFKNQ